jgi:hypothetical protein
VSSFCLPLLRHKSYAPISSAIVRFRCSRIFVNMGQKRSTSLEPHITPLPHHAVWVPLQSTLSTIAHSNGDIYWIISGCKGKEYNHPSVQQNFCRVRPKAHPVSHPEISHDGRWTRDTHEALFRRKGAGARHNTLARRKSAQSHRGTKSGVQRCRSQVLQPEHVTGHTRRLVSHVSLLLNLILPSSRYCGLG